MKAAQIDDYGDVSKLQVGEAEQPAAKSDQLLVKIGAASLNPFDLAVLSGSAQTMAPLAFPATLGLDFAGTVVEIGSDVSGFAIGDRVYGTANAMFGASGAFAEFAAVNAENAAHTPSNLTDLEAASLPTAGISGLQAIDTLKVQPGHKVFVHGGAGGAGSIAVQIAKYHGAHVAATASTDNVDFVKGLGADEVIDYKRQDYKQTISNYDAVFTTVRSESIDEVLQVLKKGGSAVSLVGPFDETKAAEQGVTVSAQMTRVSTESLDALRKLVENGAVKPVVATTYPLDTIQDAYTSLSNDSIRGKIVIEVVPIS